jgi:hypothetical protein
MLHRVLSGHCRPGELTAIAFIDDLWQRYRAETDIHREHLATMIVGVEIGELTRGRYAMQPGACRVAWHHRTRLAGVLRIREEERSQKPSVCF